jgi:uncharacterized membrane protein (DUF4010 family)
LFLFLLAGIHYLQQWFGATGFLTSSFAGGAASSVSVIASAVSLLSTNGVSVETAAFGVVLAVTASTVAKLVLLFSKNRAVYRAVVFPLLVVVAVLLGIFLV